MSDERTESEFEREQENEAAAAAGAIGGHVSSGDGTRYEQEMSEAERAVSEGGGGESEGFELAEAELEEHATHGDSHSAGRIIEDAELLDEDAPETERAAAAGEADRERPADA